MALLLYCEMIGRILEILELRILKIKFQNFPLPKLQIRILESSNPRILKKLTTKQLTTKLGTL